MARRLAEQAHGHSLTIKIKIKKDLSFTDIIPISIQTTG